MWVLSYLYEISGAFEDFYVLGAFPCFAIIWTLSSSLYFLFIEEDSGALRDYLGRIMAPLDM